MNKRKTPRYYVSRRSVLCLWAEEVEAKGFVRCMYVSNLRGRGVEEGESICAA